MTATESTLGRTERPLAEFAAPVVGMQRKKRTARSRPVYVVTATVGRNAVTFETQDEELGHAKAVVVVVRIPDEAPPDPGGA